MKLKQAFLLKATQEELQMIREELARWSESKLRYRHGTKPTIHEWYGIDFNKVDLFDRRVYEVYGTCKRLNWHFACFMSYISFALVNMSSWYEEKRSYTTKSHFTMSMKDFLREVMLPVWRSEYPFPHYIHHQ